MLHPGSEIAQLRQRLTDEYEAAQRALTGMAYGVARHDFITQRVMNMQHCHQELEQKVGPEEAKRIICEL